MCQSRNMGKQLTLCCDCWAQPGCEVYVFIHGRELLRLQCRQDHGKFKWEGSLWWNEGTDMVYKFLQMNPNDGSNHYFFEDGPDHHFHVTHDCQTYLQHDWRQTVPCLLDFRLADPHGNRIKDVHSTTYHDVCTAQIWMYPSNREYQSHHKTINLVLDIEHTTTGGHRVWEHHQYVMHRAHERYETHHVKFQFNDNFWHVGQVTRVVAHLMMAEDDSNGKPFGLFGPSRCRWELFNRDNNHVGVIGFQHSGHIERWRGETIHGIHVNHDTPVRVYFTRNNNVRTEICNLINSAKHTIHAAIYNINDSGVVDCLLHAKNRGVKIHLITSEKVLNREYFYNEGFKRLMLNGVAYTAVIRPEIEHASMHTKFAVIDGHTTLTGSCNWERRAFEVNHENLIVVEHHDVARVYLAMFECIRGNPPLQLPHPNPHNKVDVIYTHWQNATKAICSEVQKAQHRINITMFVLRPMIFWENGVESDLFRDLLAAAQRGVKVTIFLEKNTHDGGQYKTRLIPADHSHWGLNQHGIRMVKIKTMWHSDNCAAIHEKFAVIDGYVTVTGSANWWPTSNDSDDDLVIIRDGYVAWEHEMEMDRIRQHFAPDLHIW